MRHTTIGDRTVSALCLGAMQFGSTTDPDTSLALLDRFVDAGGTFIDTADCYQFWVEDGRGTRARPYWDGDGASAASPTRSSSRPRSAPSPPSPAPVWRPRKGCRPGTKVALPSCPGPGVPYRLVLP